MDYSKYTNSGTPSRNTKWTPPIPDSTMRYKSSKIPASTRVYPEYLLATYAYLEDKYGAQASSLSELISYALSEMLNLAGFTPQEIPDAATSLEFLASKGFHTADYKAAQSPHAQISMKADKQEEMARKNPLSREALEYWKLRDPEKYKALLKMWEDKLAELADDFDLEGVSQQASLDKEEEQARFEEMLTRDNTKSLPATPPPTELQPPEWEKYKPLSPKTKKAFDKAYKQEPKPSAPNEKEPLEPLPEDLQEKARRREEEQTSLMDILKEAPTSGEQDSGDTT